MLVCNARLQRGVTTKKQCYLLVIATTTEMFIRRLLLVRLFQEATIDCGQSSASRSIRGRASSGRLP
jgi:hypothetical protein